MPEKRTKSMFDMIGSGLTVYWNFTETSVWEGQAKTYVFFMIITDAILVGGILVANCLNMDIK